MPPIGSTLESITFFTLRPLVRPSFINELERITRSPFKTPGIVLTVRLPVFTPTPESTDPSTQDKPEASGSGRSTKGGAEATDTSSSQHGSPILQQSKHLGQPPLSQRDHSSPQPRDSVQKDLRSSWES